MACHCPISLVSYQYVVQADVIEVDTLHVPGSKKQ
jgi:hypothetical protein